MFEKPQKYDFCGFWFDQFHKGTFKIAPNLDGYVRTACGVLDASIISKIKEREKE